MQSSVTGNKKFLLYANITVGKLQGNYHSILVFEICDPPREISYLSDN